MAKLIRNRVTERDIRDWMTRNGFEGGSATLDSVELYAIERPGWKQLFRFEGKVRKSSLDDDETHPKEQIWGVVLDDERKSGDERTQVAIFDSVEQQMEQLDRLSEGMLMPNRNVDRAGSLFTSLVFGLIVVAIFFLIALAKRFL